MQILNLRNVVKNLPLLRKALEGTRSQLLTIVHEVLPLSLNTKLCTEAWIQMLCDGRIDTINDLVSQYLNEDSGSSKVSTIHGN